MKTPASLTVLSLAVAVLLSGAAPAGAGELTKEQQRAVERGLTWLAKQQKPDGHWEAPGARYPIALTGLAGMALLMEGSTTREGAYQHHVRRAVNFLMARSQRDGLIGDRNDFLTVRVFDHAFALRFLASVHGDEENAEQRRKLEDVLTRAVDYTVNAQTSRGGWGYVSAVEGGDFDEGAGTVVQLDALLAARSVGIAVPAKVLRQARKYLIDSTQRGGVLYGPGGDYTGARPSLTAAAIACAFASGDFRDAVVKEWVGYCRRSIPLAGPNGRDGLDYDFTHYYYARVVHTLGENGYAKLFPRSPAAERLTWGGYKAHVFKALVSSQRPDGSWRESGGVGPVYRAACFLNILQTETNPLPMPQR
jgi:hypothetical protein